MDKITSFTIDHLKLLPGVYVSRKDRVGDQVITTFDIRMTRPNYEPVMNTAEVHTIEHLAATWLRNNDEWKDRVLYFGPMGCRTGFYLLLAGDYQSRDIVPLMRRPDIRGDRAADERALYFHARLQRRGSGCLCKRLRQLPRYEPADGKLAG